MGTQSLMHPVDFYAMNLRAGLQQPAAWEGAPPADDDQWFEAGDVSMLRTPLDRKTESSGGAGRRHRYASDSNSSSSEPTDDGGSVRHEVQTALLFPLGESLAGLLETLARLQTASAHCVLASPEERPAHELPPPFSSIKRASGVPKNAALQLRQPVPSPAPGRAQLVRSKRSLFDVRLSLDDSEEEEDENVRPEPLLTGTGE